MRVLAARPPLCSALDPAAQPALERLHRSLQAFYNSEVTRRYFAAAESSNEEWTPAMRPQWHLKTHIPIGSSVLDLGCGSAHTFRHLADRQPAYVGVDWSQDQVTVNKQLYPRAEFAAASLYDVDFDRRFDAVISLYVVEHLVWPHRMLDRMFALAKPGGLIAVMTPPFRHREYLKSFDYGLSAIPFKEKVRQGRAVDALIHTYQHRHTFPRYLRRRFPRGTDHGQFLIHLEPVCLRGAAWFPDADAVYLADTDEIGRYLTARGATIVEHWPDWGTCLHESRTAGAVRGPRSAVCGLQAEDCGPQTAACY